MSMPSVVTLDNIRDAAVLSDHAGRIMDCNPAAEQMFGYARHEVLGKSAEVLYGPGQASLVASCPDNKRWACEALFLRRDGTQGICEIVSMPLCDEQGKAVAMVAVHRDITEQKRAEQYETAQEMVQRVLAGSENLAEAAYTLLWALSEALDWLWAALWEVDSKAGVLRCKSIWQASNYQTIAFKQVSQRAVFAPGSDLLGLTWASRECTYIPDLARHLATQRLSAAIQVGLRSAAYFPILTGGQVAGVIELFSQRVRSHDDGLVRCLASVSNQLGQFINEKHPPSTCDAPHPSP